MRSIKPSRLQTQATVILKWLLCLPESGGYYDQDAHTMKQMNVLMNVYRVIERLHNLHGAAIHQLTEAERAVIRELMDQDIKVN